MRLLMRFIATFIALAISIPLAAQTPPVPSDQQAALFSRILAYDRSLKARAGGQVTVGILYKAANASSRAAADSMVAAFTPLKQRTIQGLPFDVAVQQFTDPAHLQQWIGEKNIDVIYVAPGLEAEAGDIRAVTAQRGAAVLTGQRQQVQQGFTIGVVNKDGKPGIVINLTSAKALGMDLDPKLLQLAEIVH